MEGRYRLIIGVLFTLTFFLPLSVRAVGLDLLSPQEIVPFQIDPEVYNFSDLLSPELTPPSNSADGADLNEPSYEQEDYVILAAYEEDDSVKRMVEKQLNLYLTTKRNTFQTWLERSGRYKDLIQELLKKESLPPDLVFLPLIESGYKLSARSRARAVGPWQFISATAKRYGLRINYWIDERRDPVKSTLAAARYLKDLYEDFKSWPLALAAYNAGEGRIRYAIRKGRTRDYWKLASSRRYLKRETRQYVSKFIAAGIIATNPELYGFSDLQYGEPFRFDEVKINSPVSLKFVAGCTGTTVSRIKELNPELKRWCTPPDMSSYTIRVPYGKGGEFQKCYNSAKPSERMPRIPYIVRKGDTLYDIARKFGVPRREVYSMNRGINPRRLRPGMMIFLPPSDSTGRVSKVTNLRADPTLVPYKVRKGDTLYEIAKKRGIKLSKLIAINRNTDPRALRPGSTIYLPFSE